MITNGKKTKNNKGKIINIMEKESWKDVTWDIYNSSILKNMELLFNKLIIDKINDYKDKVKQYKSNIINVYI